MRWSRWLLCVGVGGMVGVSVLGQTEFDGTTEEPAPVAEEFSADAFPADVIAPGERSPVRTFAPTEEEGAVEDAFLERPVAADIVEEVESLRRKYRQLIERKSGLMDRAALREAISGAEKDIDELHAEEKLQQARQLLLELVNTHPRTKAAVKARTMLQADAPANAYGAPYGTVDPINGGRTFYQPTPDPNPTYHPPGNTSPTRDAFPDEPETAFGFEQLTPTPSESNAIKPDARKRNRNDPSPKPLDGLPTY